ncbi:MAG: response regulator transcription factor [Vicinamibacteria bacterium]|nr:response regulator transcription factor [Vicinamibacteria bacterium]
MTSRRVLVIEDDAAIRRGLVDVLHFRGYETREASNGIDGLNAALGPDYDLLLLDLVLPGGEGLEILREVRLAFPTLPVIILTAKGDEADRVNGLKLGADDYVVKPFSVKELLARVEAVLRRSPERPRPTAMLHFEFGEADLVTGEVRFLSGERSRLFPLEMELLRYLAANPGRVVSRDEILSRVWHARLTGAETRTVDVHMARLREKLRDDPERPRLIRTIRGRGYVFMAQAAPP